MNKKEKKNLNCFERVDFRSQLRTHTTWHACCAALDLCIPIGKLQVNGRAKIRAFNVSIAAGHARGALAVPLSVFIWAVTQPLPLIAGLSSQRQIVSAETTCTALSLPAG